MAKCQNCGREIHGLRGIFMIVCKDCEADWPRILQEKKEARAADKLDSIIKDHLKGEKLKDFAVVYWDTAGTAANSVVSKVVGGALFGGIGYGMALKYRRFGVIAVTETNFHLLELGDFSGENINADDILGITGQVKETCVSLRKVIIEDRSAKPSNFIRILRPIQMKVFFPTHTDPENKQKLVTKAGQIADAISSTRRNASPKLIPKIEQADQKFEPTEKDYESTGPSLPRMAGWVICPECKEKVLPKQDGTCPSCQSIIM